MVCVLFLLGCVTSFFLGVHVQRRLDRMSPPLVVERTVVQSEEEQAKEAVVSFLMALYRKDYAPAANLYQGSYEQLHDWNPLVPATDRINLLKAGCERNGLVCYEPRNIVFASRPNENTFNFNVWLSNPDKVTEFKHKNGQSMFVFTAKKVAPNKFVVETLPPYTE